MFGSAVYYRSIYYMSCQHLLAGRWRTPQSKVDQPKSILNSADKGALGKFCGWRAGTTRFSVQQPVTLRCQISHSLKLVYILLGWLAALIMNP